jgi:hypothetical protein
MACERYEDALKQLAAGAAPTVEPPRLGAPRVEPELESHLAGCARCREELDTLRRTLALVDSELRQLVAEEPSRELAVRIRLATAETRPTGRLPAFALQALATGAVLAALVFALVRGHEPATTPVARLTPRPPQAGGTPLPAPAPRAHEAQPALLPGRPVEAPMPSPASARLAVPPEPEVLVPPGQVEALQRLAAVVNRTRIAPPSLAAVEQGSPELAAPSPIEVRSVEITPLEIVPLDAAEDSGTSQGDTP